MKVILPLLFICFISIGIASAQLSFPKGFHLVAGENFSGEEDVYTNNKYSFVTHKIFREYDYKGNDKGVQKYMTEFFRFPFYLTKDSLCWGTGKVGSFYSYVIVSWDAEVIELTSRVNDEEFSSYSKWLLATCRQYKKEGKSFMFPMGRERKTKYKF